MLQAAELALFGDADFGRQGFFAGGHVGRAVEQAAQVADAGFQVVHGARFFEGFAAAEVVGFLALARVGVVAGQQVLAGGVRGVGAVVGGHGGGVRGSVALFFFRWLFIAELFVEVNSSGGA
jgi:hypothetical protein